MAESDQNTLLSLLPPEARPREKMLAKGPAALADSELLALILRTGLAGKNVLTLAAELLQNHGGLRGLLNTPPAQLQTVKGLGAAKLCQLQAVLELTRRALAQELAEKPALQSPQAVRQFLQLHLQHKTHEVFCVLFLNTQHQLISCEEMFRGTIDSAQVYPREIAARALQLGARSTILAHNHPSGLAQPSMADKQLTQRIREALALLDIQLLDHLIIAGASSYSMAERGAC
jgi:DNA repair protein RadC